MTLDRTLTPAEARALIGAANLILTDDPTAHPARVAPAALASATEKLAPLAASK